MSLTITSRADRMIDKDAIVLCPYTCCGRNKKCECNTCYNMLSSKKKKIDWRNIIEINGNIKGGKAFIRSELPKYIQDYKLLCAIEMRNVLYRKQKFQVKQDERLARKLEKRMIDEGNVWEIINQKLVRQMFSRGEDGYIGEGVYIDSDSDSDSE